MKLTQEQGALISEYLRNVTAALGRRMPAPDREDVLAKLRTTIYRALEDAGKERLSNDEVGAVIARFGAPEEQAQTLAPNVRGARSMFPDEDDVVWLGACGALADQLGIARWIVRSVGLALTLSGPGLSALSFLSTREFSGLPLALFTLSIGLLVYLGLFSYFYIMTERAARPQIPMGAVVFSALGSLIIACALHIGTGYALDLIRYAHGRFLERNMPPLGEWGWIEVQAGTMLFWTLACCLPLAVLGAMPMPGAWNDSLKKAGHAGLALYGAALAFGVASVLVGLILDLSKNLGSLQTLLP